MFSQRRTLLFICWIGIAGFYAPGVLAQPAKVDVCHIPPGNPANAHTINISERAVPAHQAHGDPLGPCQSEPPAKTTNPGDPSACACPKAGVWRVTNLDGWMECNVMGIKRKLKGADKNDGAIWILNDDCSSIFSEAYEKEREDVIMDRGRDCMYFGVAPGEEDGAEVIFDGAYELVNEEFITGEYWMEMGAQGMKCEGYRPFDIEFLEPLKEKDMAKAEKKMQKQLDAAREYTEEHRAQIDEYLEETDGGKAFGGRNSGE